MITYIKLNDALLWIERVLCFSAFIHNTVMFIHVVWKNRKNKELAKENDLSYPLYRVTQFVVGSYAIYGLISILTACAELYPDSIHCLSWYAMMFIMYLVSKFGVWYYNLIRLKVVFQQHKDYQYSALFLRWLLILFITVTITCLIFTITASHVHKMVFHNENSHCVFHGTLWFLIPLGLLDSCTGILCYWLLYRKMSKLSSVLENYDIMGSDNQSTVPSEQEKQGNYDLLYVLRKYTIMAAFTLISTWLSAGFATFSESPIGLFCVDSIINVWCIILYDARYDRVYNILCSCFARNDVLNKLLTKTHKEKNEINMEIQLETN